MPAVPPKEKKEEEEGEGEARRPDRISLKAIKSTVTTVPPEVQSELNVADTAQLPSHM